MAQLPTESPDEAAPSTMPVAFLGHGSPMNALDRNRYTEAWRAFGAESPRPRAILVVSAHWYINASAVTGMAKPRTIHDFYGFPDELFAVDYPAPGDPELAEEVAELVKPTAAAEIMTGAPADLARLGGRHDFALAAPTPDHFIPLLYVAAAAAAEEQTASVLVDGYAMGSLSMTSYTVGCHEIEPVTDAGAPALPQIPADETNM